MLPLDMTSQILPEQIMSSLFDFIDLGGFIDAGGWVLSWCRAARQKILEWFHAEREKKQNSQIDLLRLSIVNAKKVLQFLSSIFVPIFPWSVAYQWHFHQIFSIFAFHSKLCSTAGRKNCKQIQCLVHQSATRFWDNF